MSSLSPPPRPPTPRTSVTQNAAPQQAAKPLATLLPLNSPLSPSGAFSYDSQLPQTNVTRKSSGAGQTEASVKENATTGVSDPYGHHGTVATHEDEKKERRRREREERRRNRESGNGGGGILSLNFWTSVAGISILVAIASAAVTLLVALDQFERGYRDDVCESIIQSTVEGDRWLLLSADQSVAEQFNLENKYKAGSLSEENYRKQVVPKGRLGHAACVVNGIMYIHGGLHGVPVTGSPTAATSTIMSDLWSYDIKTKSWTEVIFNQSAPHPGGRLHHSIVALSNNRSFALVGGFNNETTRDGHDSYNDVWEFDTINKTWIKLEINRLMTKAIFNEYKEIEDATQRDELKAFNVLKDKRLEIKRGMIRVERKIAHEKAMADHKQRSVEREARNAVRAVRRTERQQRIDLRRQQEQERKDIEARESAALQEEKRKEETLRNVPSNTSNPNVSSVSKDTILNESIDATTAMTSDADDTTIVPDTSSSHNDSSIVAANNTNADETDEYEECTGDDCEEEEEEEEEEDGVTISQPLVNSTTSALANDSDTANKTHEVELEPEIEDDEEAEPSPVFDENANITVEDDHAPYRPPRHRTMFPYPRGAHETALSPCGKYLYVFGGHRQIFTDPSSELWRFSLKDQYWEEVTPRNESFPHLPSRRVGFSLGVVGGSAYLFGGACVHGSLTESNGQCSDTWEFNFGTGKWTFINTTTAATGNIPVAFTAPGARRAGHSVVVVDDMMFLFGGVYLDNTNHSPEGSRLYDDLWVFSPNATNVTKGTWTPLFPNYRRGPRPGPTFGHSIVAIGKSILVFGGRHRTIDHHGSNELWEYRVLKA